MLNDCPDALPGTVAIEKATLVPATGFPFASVTVTTKGLARAAPAIALCVFPEVRFSRAAAPATTVKLELVAVASASPEVRAAASATPVSALV